MARCLWCCLLVGAAACAGCEEDGGIEREAQRASFRRHCDAFGDAFSTAAKESAQETEEKIH